MRKILFDLTVYQTGTTFHGGGEYSYAILKELMEKKTSKEQVDVFIGTWARKDDELLKKCTDAGMQVHTCADAADLTRVMKEGDYDILYSALPTPKHFKGLQLDPKVRMIITLHGLRKLELREGGMYQYYSTLRKSKSDTLELLKRALRPGKYREFLKDEYNYLLNITENYIAVTDSYHSYCNILRYYPEIGQERLRMYLCPGKIAEKIDDPAYEQKILAEYGIKSKNFGLVISANRFEKNPVRSLKAWDDVYSECGEIVPKDFKTVVLGTDHPDKFLRMIKNKDRFVFKGYVEDAELETLYKHTHLLVFASLNEGFGYPPMEAMKYGTFVAASVNTSIPESCGDAAFMFNPLIVSEISNRILQSFHPWMQKFKAEQIPKQVEQIVSRQEEALHEIGEMILHEEW